MARRLGSLTDKSNHVLTDRIDRHVGSPFFAFVMALLAGLFFLWPAGRFGIASLVDFEWSQLSLVYARLLYRTLVSTLLQAGLSALFAWGLGSLLGLALFLQRQRSIVKKLAIFERVGALFFTLPGTAMALYVIILSRSIFGISAIGLWAIVGAHVLMNACMIGSSLYRSLRLWEQAGGREQLEAAAILGASKRRLLCTVLAPIYRAEFRFWAPLVFLYSAMAFSTVLILGGGPQHATPEVLLFYSLSIESSSTRIFTTALMQVIFSFSVVGVILKYAPSKLGVGRLFNSEGIESYRVKNSLLSLVAVVPCLLVGFFFVLPLLALRNVLPSVEVFFAMAISFSLALMTGLFSKIFYLLSLAARPWWRRMASRFLGVSATLYLLLWNFSNLEDFLPTATLGRLVTLAFLMALCVLPLTCFWIESRLGAFTQESIAAAMVLGCAPQKIPMQLFRPALRDLESRIFVSAALFALGEIALCSYFGAELPLLSLMSRKMAARYDFSGSSWVLLAMGLFTLALMSYQRIFRKGVGENFGPRN